MYCHTKYLNHSKVFGKVSIVEEENIDLYHQENVFKYIFG